MRQLINATLPVADLSSGLFHSASGHRRRLTQSDVDAASCKVTRHLELFHHALQESDFILHISLAQLIRRWRLVHKFGTCSLCSIL